MTNAQLRDSIFEDRLRFVMSNLTIAADLIRSGNIHGGLHIIKSCSAPGLLEEPEPVIIDAVSRFTLRRERAPEFGPTIPLDPQWADDQTTGTA